MDYPPETAEDAARVDSILRTIAKKRINRNHIVASDELLAAISRDGYIDSERVGSNDEYFLTEFGMYFLIHGGFEKKLLDAKDREQSMKREEERASNESSMAYSAILSAICASIAIALTIIQCATNTK